VTDYTALSNEQLSELIHRLSVESRNRYETERELEKVRKAQKEKWDADLKAYLTSPRYTLDAIHNNIDAKPPVSPSEAIPDGE
jgi:hypothetical protein